MGATKEQMQGLYDALAQQDRATAETLADRINPTLKELVGRNPTAVMRTAAGLLGDPDRSAREVQWQDAAAAPADTGKFPYQDAITANVDALKKAAPVAASIGAGLLAERGGMRAIQPVLKALATNPTARTLLTRAVQGIAGTAGALAPEAIQEGSLDPYTRSPKLNMAAAALPVAGSVVRRLIPGAGGALREAGKMGGELAKFSGAADPAVAALTPKGVVAESGLTPPPFKPTLTPAMRKELVAMGVPAKSLQRLTPNKAAALVEELQAIKQQIGMGERPAVLPPPPVAPPAPVAAPPVVPPDFVTPSQLRGMAPPPVQPPMAPPQAAGPPVAPPVAPAPPVAAAAGPSLEDQLRASLPPEVAASVPPSAPPPMAPPGTTWTPKGPPGAPAAAPVTPETLAPEQVQDLVGDVLNHVDMLQGNAPPLAAAVGQGGGDASLLTPFTAPSGPRKIGRRSKVR